MGWGNAPSGTAQLKRQAAETNRLRARMERAESEVALLIVERNQARAARDGLHALIVEADSLCSLILHRESSGLTDITKGELDGLVRRLRRVTDPR